MSFITPSPVDCCSPCTEPVVTNIPGVPGTDGAAGAAGANGNNAYTVTTDNFIMPAEGGTVIVDVALSGWAVIGQVVAVGDPAGAAFGYFQVTAIPGATQITLLNLENTAAGTYAANSAVGTVFPATSAVSPAGLQGPTGLAGTSGAPDDATYITQTLHVGLSAEVPMGAKATGLVHNLNGTGIDSIVPLGVADDYVAPVDQAAGLTNNRMVAATAAGLETPTQANARTYLGLGTMATQNANNVAITGGTITGVTIATSGIPFYELIYEHQAASATESGTANVGWNVVPLNTEVLDMGANGVLAANIVTLKAGTYRAEWFVQGYLVDSFITRFFNVDTALAIAYGNSACAASALGTPSVTGVSSGAIRVTFAVDTQVELQMYVQTQNLVNAYGKACGFGVTEVYSRLVLVKET